MSFDFFQPVPLTINVKDIAGQLADASNVTLTIILPDGSIAPSTIPSHPSLGIYEFDYQPLQAGLHSVQWAATGANASAFSDTFDVRPPTPPYIVSLTDAKNFLNLTTSANDEELRGFVEAATQVVENLIGPVVVRTVTEVHTRPGPVLILQQKPAISLVSLTSVLSGGDSYDVSLLDLDPTSGIVRRVDGIPIGRTRPRTTPVPLRVIYTAGRPVVPASVTLATRIIIDNVWTTQRGHSEGVRPLPGRPAPKKGRPAPDLIPPLAMELLQPHRRTFAIM